MNRYIHVQSYDPAENILCLTGTGTITTEAEMDALASETVALFQQYPYPYVATDITSLHYAPAMQQYAMERLQGFLLAYTSGGVRYSTAAAARIDMRRLALSAGADDIAATIYSSQEQAIAALKRLKALKAPHEPDR